MDTIPVVVDLMNLTIRVEPELRAKLDAIAKREDRSVGYIVRRMLNAAIEADEAERGKK